MKLDKYERQLLTGILLAATLIAVVLVGSVLAIGATIERTAPAGTKINVGIETVATVGTEPITVTVTPQGTVAPPPDVVFTPPSGMTIKRLTSGVGTLTLQSNTCYLSSTFESGGRAKLTSSGTIVTCPSGVHNVLVKGVDFQSSSTTADAMRVVADTLAGVTFDDCGFTGGRDNVVWQGRNIDGGCTTKDLAFRGCRFIDPLGNVDRSGQNLFLANIDGLTLDGCFGVNAGFKQPVRTIYTHFAYIKEGNRRVLVKDCFVSNPQAVGIQARGPVHKYTDSDGGDPGPTLTGNVIYKAAIAIMGNGRKGTFVGNTIFVGPHAHAVNTGGESGLYLSVGSAVSTDNVVVHSPVFDSGTVFPAFNNAPRSDRSTMGDGSTMQWGYSLTCTYSLNARNVSNKSKVVNLDDLVTSLRGRGDIKAAVAEAKRRAA